MPVWFGLRVMMSLKLNFVGDDRSPAPIKLIATTTTIQIVIQTALLIVLFQKLIKTDAALSSAGSTITQWYLKGI